MAKVYELAVDSDTREILLALADHADDDGYSVYPSVARIAWKIGDGSKNERGEYKNHRTVQRRIKELQDIGALVELRRPGFHRPTEYGLDLSVFPKKDSFVAKGDNLSQKGDKNALKGDRAMSPEPSVNVSETKTSPAVAIENPTHSNNPYQTWESVGLTLNPYIAQQLTERAQEYSDHWVCEAIRRAAHVNKRNLAYIDGILRRWHEKGAMDTAPESKESPPKLVPPAVQSAPRWVQT